MACQLPIIGDDLYLLGGSGLAGDVSNHGRVLPLFPQQPIILQSKSTT